MRGRIIKGIAGFYYVHAAESGIYACKAKGIFRKDNVKPLVGDEVRFVITDPVDREGNIEEILPRSRVLYRPAVANAHQALVIFSVKKPFPNFLLLDKFLVYMEQSLIPAAVCFNKTDLSDDADDWTARYEAAGYRVFLTCAKTGEGVDEVRKYLKSHMTVVAGPSGVGKSSLINLLQPEARMETGAVSEKLKRGRHTTRHDELIPLDEDSYIIDTPGFTSLILQDIEPEEVKEYFPEFHPLAPECRFHECLHLKEPDCRVRQAVEEGTLDRVRYDNYAALVEEVRGQRKY